MNQTALRIAALKSEAHRLYLRFNRRAGELSCGAKLASFIRPDIDADERRFNEVMAELRTIDPTAPAALDPSSVGREG